MPITVRPTKGFGEISIQGAFFTKDVTNTILQNASRAVEDLAEQGRDLVRQVLDEGIQKDTGFTRRNIEGFVYKHRKVRPGKGGSTVTVYGKVRMKPKLRRGTRSGPNYTPANVPYIIERVLESGAYGGYSRYAGRRGGRSYNIWVSGYVSQRKRRTLGQFKRSATVMRRRARTIRTDLTEGLT